MPQIPRIQGRIEKAGIWQINRFLLSEIYVMLEEQQKKGDCL